MEAKETIDIKLKQVLEDECGLGFPADYYDAVDPEDFRKVFKAGVEEVAKVLRTHLIKMMGVPVGYLIIGGELDAKLKEWEVD